MEIEKLAKEYLPLMEEYAKPNDIEIPQEEDDDDFRLYYGLIRDAKFIDFAYDRSGIIFNKNMFGVDDESLEEFYIMDKERNSKTYKGLFGQEEWCLMSITLNLRYKIKSNLFSFKAKLAKMGDNRIIWIPLALHEMIRDYEDEELIVSIKKYRAK